MISDYLQFKESEKKYVVDENLPLKYEDENVISARILFFSAGLKKKNGHNDELFLFLATKANRIIITQDHGLATRALEQGVEIIYVGRNEKWYLIKGEEITPMERIGVKPWIIC